MKAIVCVLILMSLIGCASVDKNFVFNGDSASTIKADINYLLNTLPTEKRKDLILALVAIRYSEVDSGYDLLFNPKLQKMDYELLSSKLDGLTYSQALALASASPTKVRAGKH